MERVSKFESIGPHAFTWQGYDPAVKCDLTSTAIDINGQFVIFDPIALTSSAWTELVAGRNPSAILLTNANHQRDSLAWRDRLGIPIIAPASTSREITADHWIDEDDSLPVAGLQAISLPGAGLGEMAYYQPGTEPRLVIGDAVINLLPEGLRLLPDKYCEDPDRLRASIASLARLPVHTIHFAHGRPITLDSGHWVEDLLGGQVGKRV